MYSALLVVCWLNSLDTSSKESRISDTASIETLIDGDGGIKMSNFLEYSSHITVMGIISYNGIMTIEKYKIGRFD
jgi:hypothetical protein